MLLDWVGIGVKFLSECTSNCCDSVNIFDIFKTVQYVLNMFLSCFMLTMKIGIDGCKVTLINLSCFI